MKMNQQDYKYLQFCIIEKLSEAPPQAINDLRKKIPYAKSQFISFCWYILHASIRNDTIAFSILNDYKDEHIETAIKKNTKRL